MHGASIPEDAIEVSKEVFTLSMTNPGVHAQWRYDIATNELVVVKNKDIDNLLYTDLVNKKITEITNHINSRIREAPYYYDEKWELSNWVNDEEYGNEAKLLLAWCNECDKVWVAVKDGDILITEDTRVTDILPNFPF